MVYETDSICTVYMNNCLHEQFTLVCTRTVPGPVSGLSATSGIVQLNVSWNPPSEPNGVIIVYEVRFNISGVFSYINTSATQHTLRDLPQNSVVTFRVRAYTIIGPGEHVTGQASTESVRKYVSFLINTLQSPNCNNNVYT